MTSSSAISWPPPYLGVRQGLPNASLSSSDRASKTSDRFRCQAHDGTDLETPEVDSEFCWIKEL